MPWTPKEVRFLLSKVSPLSSSQKAKMKLELHENPKLGHYRKGQIHQRITLKTRRNANP